MREVPPLHCPFCKLTRGQPKGVGWTTLHEPHLKWHRCPKLAMHQNQNLVRCGVREVSMPFLVPQVTLRQTLNYPANISQWRGQTPSTMSLPYRQQWSLTSSEHQHCSRGKGRPFPCFIWSWTIALQGSPCCCVLWVQCPLKWLIHPRLHSW